MSDFYDKLYEKPKFKVQVPEQAVPLPPDIDVTDKDALRALSLRALAQVVQAGKSDASIVAAAKELLDRIDGKAAQVTKSDVTVTHRAEVIKQVLDGIIVEAVPKYIEADE